MLEIFLAVNLSKYYHLPNIKVYQVVVILTLVLSTRRVTLTLRHPREVTLVRNTRNQSTARTSFRRFEFPKMDVTEVDAIVFYIHILLFFSSLQYEDNTTIVLPPVTQDK